MLSQRYRLWLRSGGYPIAFVCLTLVISACYVSGEVISFSEVESDNEQMIAYENEILEARKESLATGILKARELRSREGVSLVNQIRLGRSEAGMLKEAKGYRVALKLYTDIAAWESDSENVFQSTLVRDIENTIAFLKGGSIDYEELNRNWVALIPVFKQYGIPSEVVDVYFSISYSYEMIDDYDGAYDALLKAKSYAVESGDLDSTAWVDVNLGYWVMRNGQPDVEALDNLNAASEYYREQNDLLGLLNANLVILHNSYKLFGTRDLGTIDECLDLAQKVGAVDQEIAVLRNKAQVLRRLERYEEAVSCRKRAQRLSSSAEMLQLESWIWGELLRDMVQSENDSYKVEIFEIVEQRLPVAIEDGDQFSEANISYMYGIMLVREKRYQEAKPFIEKAAAFYGEYGYDKDYRGSQALLGDVYRSDETFEKAYGAMSLAYETGLKLWEEEYQQRIAKTSFQLNSAIRENELKVSKMENELANSKIREQELRINFQHQQVEKSELKRRNILLLLVITLIVLVSIIVLYWRNHRHKKKLLSLTGELQQEVARRETIDEDRKRILGIVAHDMKNPIAAIESLLEIVEVEYRDMKVQKDHTVYEYLNLCRKNTKYMNELVHKIIDARKVDFETERLQLQWTSPQAMIEETMHLNEMPASQKEMVLTLRAPECSGVEVYCDIQAFREAFDNLISNAIKYSETGSEILVLQELEGEVYQLSVVDGGPGFTDEDFKNLFKEFEKLSATPTGGESSSGIGLSSVKRYMDAMEGDVRVVNMPNASGAKVTLKLKGRVANP